MENNKIAYLPFLGLAQLISLSSNPGILGIGTAQALVFSLLSLSLSLGYFSPYFEELLSFLAGTAAGSVTPYVRPSLSP